MLLLIFGDELFYYTTFKFICQPLFGSFFKFSFLWRSLLRDSFNIISHSKFFVKYFFQVFSKNFFVTAVPFPDQLFYYITSELFCQPLFRSFFKFVFPWYLNYLCDSFSIISLSHQLVKYFLFKFLILPIESWHLYYHISNLTPRAAPAVLPFCSVVFRDSKYIITPLPWFVKKIVFNIHVWIVWNCWKNKKAAAKATAQFQYLMINQYQP